MVYKLYQIQQLTRMQQICEIENEKVKQRTQRANDLQESEIEESIIEYKEKKLKCQGIIAFRLRKK